MAETGSLDQQRAAYAWTCVGEDPSKDYVNLAKGAPALIMSNGLMQTLAFYQSKGKAHHKDLVKHINGWLGIRLAGRKPAEKAPNFNEVMGTLHGADSDFYLRATEETLEVLRWVRQLAAARSKKGG